MIPDGLHPISSMRVAAAKSEPIEGLEYTTVELGSTTFFGATGIHHLYEQYLCRNLQVLLLP
jgi:hypothetical protein